MVVMILIWSNFMSWDNKFTINNIAKTSEILNKIIF